MRTWGKILLGIAAALLAALAAALLFIYSGAYNVAATAEDAGLVRWVLETTQERSVRAHADAVEITVPTDSAAVHRGFRSYEQMCVVCHGAPGVERGWMGQGMNPTPPALHEEAAEFTDEELYWILANGIKMAGMPALSPTHSEAEILEIAAFLKRLPQLSADAYRARRETLQLASGAEEPAPDGHDGHDHTH